MNVIEICKYVDDFNEALRSIAQRLERANNRMMEPYPQPPQAPSMPPAAKIDKGIFTTDISSMFERMQEHVSNLHGEIVRYEDFTGTGDVQAGPEDINPVARFGR